MGWRVAHNKGQIDYPSTFTVRVTDADKAYIAQKGGSNFIREALGVMRQADTQKSPLLNAKKTGRVRRTRRTHAKAR